VHRGHSTGDAPVRSGRAGRARAVRRARTEPGAGAVAVAQMSGAGPTGGGLLVAGTHSDAGKSVITAGVCRWLHRRGVRVAPFKAQNMSNNSAIAIDASGRGGEIGRAQALQAAACGLAPDVRFNPVLLKPGSDLTSQVILLGEAVGQIGAGDFA